MMKKDALELVLIAALGLSTMGNIALAASLSSERAGMQSTMVKGYACTDSKGSIYALEEDELPLCQFIERATIQQIKEESTHAMGK